MILEFLEPHTTCSLWQTKTVWRPKAIMYSSRLTNTHLCAGVAGQGKACGVAVDLHCSTQRLLCTRRHAAVRNNRMCRESNSTAQHTMSRVSTTSKESSSHIAVQHALATITRCPAHIMHALPVRPLKHTPLLGSHTPHVFTSTLLLLHTPHVSTRTPSSPVCLV